MTTMFLSKVIGNCKACGIRLLDTMHHDYTPIIKHDDGTMTCARCERGEKPLQVLLNEMKQC